MFDRFGADAYRQVGRELATRGLECSARATSKSPEELTSMVKFFEDMCVHCAGDGLEPQLTMIFEPVVLKLMIGGAFGFAAGMTTMDVPWILEVLEGAVNWVLTNLDADDQGSGVES